jgi:ABC-type antimicrobial peptide transport system permease subunit
MGDLVRDAAAQPRLHTSLLVAFAVFALLLALGGVFATAAYAVVQRRREIAVRAALGAEPAVLFRWSMASTLMPAAWGTGAGMVGAFWSSRLLTAELFSVRPNDAVVLAGAALVLMLVAVSGGVAPAWRASRTRPAGVLRTE